MSNLKGLWVWVLDDIRPDYLAKLKECNVGRVYLKIFDGRSSPMFWSFQCTKAIVQELQDNSIEVYGWGYHYGTKDVTAQVDAVRKGIDCGVDGYVVDVEAEVEDTATHSAVEQLLEELKVFVPSGRLGYTSFGNPKFHPNVPWKILDRHCDVAMPQIYFEKFTFGKNTEDEVQQCIKAHEELGLTSGIQPIWGSESDAKEPASRPELQGFLDRFPGSSLWRVPNLKERGVAWELNYNSIESPSSSQIIELPILPLLNRVLKRGRIGNDVTALQTALNVQRIYNSEVDGDFGSDTEKAVRRFQQKSGLTVDGEVWTETWKALGGKVLRLEATRGVLEKLGDFAEDEASRQLRWLSASSEAEKYLDIFRKPMQERGQIGSAKEFYDWCGAFVFYCCKEVGVNIPFAPNEFWATFALVESWKFWGRQQGFWFPKGVQVPRRGDIVVFDWDGDGELNHIGIVKGYTPNSLTINTSEGNRQNLSGNYTRSLSDVAGFIRIL